MRTWTRQLVPLVVSATVIGGVMVPGLLASSAAAAGSGAATLTAPSSARIGSTVHVALHAAACAKAPVTLSLSTVTATGSTQVQTLARRIANGSGRASWTVHLPRSAAKSTESRRAYWTATSTTKACQDTVGAVAAATQLTPKKSATVRVSKMTATTVQVTGSKCTGGIAQAFFVTADYRRIAATGLPDGASFSATLTLPSGARALFLDCVAAKVSSFSAHGLSVSKDPAPRVTNSPPTWPSGSGSSVALESQQVCTGGGAPGRWPVVCTSTGSPESLSGPDGLSSSPEVWRQQESLLGTTAYLADFAPADAQLAAAGSTSTPATTKGKKKTARPAAGSTTTTTTSNKDGTTTTTTTTTTKTATGSDTTSVSTVVLGRKALDALRKTGVDYRSLTLRVVLRATSSFDLCPDTGGDLTDPLVVRRVTSLSGVDHLGGEIESTVTDVRSASVALAVGDTASFASYAVTGTATLQVDQNTPAVHQLASASYLHTFPLTTPDGNAMLKQVNDSFSATTIHRAGSPELLDGVGESVGKGVAGAVVLAAKEGKAAFVIFNDNAACIAVHADGDTDVSPGGSTDLAVSVTDQAGGAVSLPAAIHASLGEVQPTSATLNDTTPQTVHYTAPSSTDATSASLSFTGGSRRGRLDGSVTITLHPQTGVATLHYSATLSIPHDTCRYNTPIGTFVRCHYIPDDAIDGNDSYSGAFASALSADVPITGTTDLSTAAGSGSGDLDETVSTMTSNGTFQNGFEEIDCVQSGTEAFTPAGVENGTLTVSSLTATGGGSGRPGDLDLQLSPDQGDLNENYSDHLVLTASGGDECLAVGSHTFIGNQREGQSLLDDANRSVLHTFPTYWELTGWTINPSWTATGGGVLATKTVTYSESLPAPDAGTATVTQHFSVSTAPTGH